MRRRYGFSVASDVTLTEAMAQLKDAGAVSADVLENGRVVGMLVAHASSSGKSSIDPSEEAFRLATDLHLARKIHRQLLPRAAPRVPGLAIHGALHSAAGVGGDYWSAKFYAGDDRATLKLVDVTGHGIAAGILVPAVKYLSGGFYRGAPNPAWVMTRTNHSLVKETPVEMLVSMVYAWYNVSSRELEVVNAGHRPAFFVSGGEVIDIPSTGPVLGLIEVEYESILHPLNPGDIFFTCSDGITEARKDGIFFGEDRVKSIVLDHRRESAARIAEAVLKSCDEFNRSRHDDRSLLVARALDL
ncbi:MAG: SpoIIE family protein phosphatase [Armatimonadota bacterium]|nr:SpoIIE family protein phosphatase [Armatimonadota bacterium]